MSDLQELLRIHYEGNNAGDLDRSLSVFDPDCELVTPLGAARGAAAQRAMGEAFLNAAPDSRLEAQRTFEDADTLVVEGTYSGTHTGDLVGPAGTIPATGRAFSFTFVDILQARDGKFISHRIYWDMANFLAQLGVA